MLLTDKILFFENLPLFSSLVPEEFETLRSISIERKFAKGEFLFQEGDTAKGILILKQGYVKVLKQSASGKNVAIRLVFPNEIMGEVAMFCNIPYPVSAEALVDTIAYEISKAKMLLFTKMYPDMVLKFLGVCASRLSEAYSTIDRLAHRNIEQRIASTLLRLANNGANNGRKNNVREIIIDILLTRQDLAEMVGGTHESVCRVMANLKRKKIIKSMSRKIIVIDLVSLKAIAENDL